MASLHHQPTKKTQDRNLPICSQGIIGLSQDERAQEVADLSGVTMVNNPMDMIIDSVGFANWFQRFAQEG